MKTAELILNFLADGTATTRAIADKLTQPTVVISAFCRDLELEGRITRQRLTPEVTAWHLTHPQPA